MKRQLINVCTFVVLLSALAAPLLAQSGDRGDTKQPEVWRNFDIPPSPVVPPEKAVDTFKVAPGFRIELVAAEPLVEDPVAITWDADGRIWAVEMRGYMPNVDGKGEDARVGRVVVLEDTNGDGRMDKSTVFLDELQMPRAIAVVAGGVLVAEPPTLWFCKDTDGDLKCDVKVEAYKGYARQGPVEHTDNGLLFGLDNWIYNAKSTLRFRVNQPGSQTTPTAVADGAATAAAPILTVDSTRFRGQWGITQDNFGRLYHNSNSSYLSADFVSADYYQRNPNYTGSSWGFSRGVASDQNVWSIRPNTGINRGYQGPMLRSDGRQARTTATCGPGIYRGDQFPPEYVGDAFVPEPAGNVVAHFRMSENDKGELRGQHTIYDDPKWSKREFVASTDERFRPINCYTGPDGCLYIVDLYRGILQHRIYVTTFLRKQIIERELDKPVGLGRIYRVVHEGRAPSSVLKLSAMPSMKLVELLSHPNGYYRDAAQRLLIERNDVTTITAMRTLAASGSPDEFADTSAKTETSPLGRIHALWTLEGMNALDYATVQAALRDPEVKVKMTAVRMCETVMAHKAADQSDLDQQKTLVDALLALSSTKNIELRRQLAFSLSVIRAPSVGNAVRDMLLAYGSDASIRDAILSGLGGRELEFLQRLLADSSAGAASGWSKNDGTTRAVVASLADCIAREGDKQRVARLFDAIASETDDHAWRRNAMLDAVVSYANPNGRKPRAIHYDEQPLAMLKLSKLGDKHVDGSLEKLAAFVTWGAAAAPPPPPPPLSPEHQKLFDTGKELYAMTCASCHLASALGEEGKAPPLLDSHWLLGPESRVVRIVLLGLTGPIEVHGRTYKMEMPPLKGFSDEQVAAILTYARREWEHAGTPIDAATVTRIRKEIGDREASWTAAELLKLK